MQFLLTFILVVFVVVTVSAGDDDECTAQGFKMGDCCPFDKFVPPAIMASGKICKQNYFSEKRPSTPSEIQTAVACTVECAFTMEGLLTAEKTLDKAAITKLFTPTDAALVPTISAKLEQCLDSYEDSIDSTSECNSGANEFSICFKKEVFLNCPSSIWIGSAECDKLKAKAIKCPMVPLLIEGST